MNKISIIIAREYKTRVMKKSFILLTFLTPLLFVAMLVIPMWLANIKDNNIHHIVVIDKTGLYKNALKNNDFYTFVYSDLPEENYKNTHSDKKNVLTAVLQISEDLSENPKAVTLYSEKQISLELKTYISQQLADFVQNQKLTSYNIPNIKEIVENAKTDINIQTIKWDEKGREEKTSAELALIIGTIAAVLIYMFIMVYGAQVMSGVVQEKVNRIVEVMISSVKPFQLMMGKIIGIALVGLTQFFMWILLTGILFGVFSIFAGASNPETVNQLTEVTSSQAVQMQTSVISGNTLTDTISSLNGVNFFEIILLFIVYFLGGYLLYASLFAAVGSAVDNETDTQQFSMPLTLPIFFAVYAAIYSAQNPDGPLAFWCSMIPFTSPVVMMVRLPFDVPLWQILLSVSILILSFIGTVWLAAKIYRTGILMYGKKPTWKEMWKWVRMS
ncbi:ABC transporter permease [uncultured Paludibacter sp.]|nr:ABC transporter permease [uncultured Paludibacter sp.]